MIAKAAALRTQFLRNIASLQLLSLELDKTAKAKSVLYTAAGSNEPLLLDSGHAIHAPKTDLMSSHKFVTN
jgi:hypothetical protein